MRAVVVVACGSPASAQLDLGLETPPYLRRQRWPQISRERAAEALLRVTSDLPRQRRHAGVRQRAGRRESSGSGGGVYCMPDRGSSAQWSPGGRDSERADRPRPRWLAEQRKR
ncbi:hypothetical protein ACP4OV_030661 [Aristida adscensionis]